MKRVVTDSLWVQNAPVSFNQVSFKSKKYEGICPWCTKSIGKVKASTYGDLYLKLLPIQAEHMDTCNNRESVDIMVKIRNKVD